jgi:hypothetical protein
LLTTAVYDGMRIETRSQHRTSSPQVTAELESGDAGIELKLSLQAERLRDGDYMTVLAEHVQRGVDIGAVCASPNTNPVLVGSPASEGASIMRACGHRPCRYLETCVFVRGC